MEAGANWSFALHLSGITVGVSKGSSGLVLLPQQIKPIYLKKKLNEVSLRDSTPNNIRQLPYLS